MILDVLLHIKEKICQSERLSASSYHAVSKATDSGWMHCGHPGDSGWVDTLWTSRWLWMDALWTSRWLWVDGCTVDIQVTGWMHCGHPGSHLMLLCNRNKAFYSPASVTFCKVKMTSVFHQKVIIGDLNQQMYMSKRWLSLFQIDLFKKKNNKNPRGILPHHLSPICPGPLLLSECTVYVTLLGSYQWLSFTVSFVPTSSTFLAVASLAQISQKATALKIEISK